MKTLFRCALGTLVGLTASPALADDLLVSVDYDNPAFVAGGVSVVTDDVGFEEIASVGAWNAAGWAGQYYVNRTTGNPAGLSFATLSGLAPNSGVRIGSGVLGFLESWDSTNGSGGFTPDYLDIFLNGVLVASLTSDNASGSIETYSGATELFDGQEVNGTHFYSDTLVDLSTATFANSFADASGNWTLGIQARGAGWQGSGDEGWGLDNWSIFGTVARGAVPEPATWGMMLLGFGMIGGAMRHRRKVAANVSFA